MMLNKSVKLIKSTYLLLILIGFLGACSKSTDNPAKPDPKPPVKPEEEITYSSDYKYNLNVIYFVPKNVTPNPDYEERISKILIEGQNFFSKWMKHWGFGDKTYGLLKNKENTRVKIHLIRGPEDAIAYATNKPIEELFYKYFQDNPTAKSSDHYLILTATNKKLDQGEEIGHEVPFYGVGRTCYALDYPGMKQENLGKGGTISEKATVYIGGLLHEMGHGINLPHNGPSASKINDPQFGMTLMGSGNYTYGKSPTYLSFFDAATLNNCQVFSKETKTFYEPVNAKVNTIQAKVENNEIVINGTYAASNTVKHITFKNILATDPQGYQSITFTTVPGSGNTFSVKMPVSEFRTKANMEYSLEIFFHHENGNKTSVFYPFKFVNDQPVVDFGDRTMLSRTGWEVIAYSSQQGGLEASKMLDGNDNTYWHTSWTTPTPHPHYVTIRTGAAAVTAQGLSYLNRHDNSGNGGKIKNFIIEISNDGNSWTKVDDYVGHLNGRQYYSFNGSKTFQYIKLTTSSDYEGKTHATIAELNLY